MSHDSTPPPERHGAGTYQMLWDCKFCGAEKLLGVTHRHCPNCGALQDPAARYMPAEADMVALENHQYVGADRICPACHQPNSAASAFCAECGADLATGEIAPTQGVRDLGTGIAESDTHRDVVLDNFQAEMARVGVLPGRDAPVFLGIRRRNWFIFGGLVLAALLIAGIVFALTYRRETSGYVYSMSWERVIDIDDFQPRPGANWDDALPGDAYNLSCVEKQHGTRRVETGSHQECSDVDQGDGSFRRECHTVKDYSQEPVYDDWCSYTVDRWEKTRSVKANGDGKKPSPTWPPFTLKTATGRYGQEREGKHHEKYVIVIHESDGDEYSCDYDSLETWDSFDIETRVTIELNVMGNAVCSTLKRAN
ncbi:MAG: zinc ribbon domain-containing protein [Anaerolineae bacterium]|nr:zinc ribbon domain-containing protein [Anaerolineae bacterium]